GTTSTDNCLRPGRLCRRPAITPSRFAALREDFQMTTSTVVALFVRSARPRLAATHTRHGLSTTARELRLAWRTTRAIADVEGPRLVRARCRPGPARNGRERADARDGPSDSRLGDFWPGPSTGRCDVGPARRYVQHADRRQEPVA